MVEINGLNGSPDGSIWCPAESDFPSRKKSAWEGGWFWRANREQDVLPLSGLIQRYYTTVGRNTNMLIGMAIDTSGQFPAKETHLFEQFGREIKERFSHSLAEKTGRGDTLILNLGKNPVRVNQVVIMEDISKGERIREYSVEAWINNKWLPVCNGISIGHKRIQTFNMVVTDTLRLHISKDSRTPVIRKFAAYYINGLNE